MSHDLFSNFSRDQDLLKNEKSVEVFFSLRPNEFLYPTDVKLMEYVHQLMHPKSWTKLIHHWKESLFEFGSTNHLRNLLNTYVLSQLSKYPQNYDTKVMKCLLREIICLFDENYSTVVIYHSWTKFNEYTNDLAFLLRMLDKVENKNIKEAVLKSLKEILLKHTLVNTVSNLKKLKEILSEKQFLEVGEVFLGRVINTLLDNIKREHSFYNHWKPTVIRVKEICALFIFFSNTDRVLDYLISRLDVNIVFYLMEAFDDFVESLSCNRIRKFVNCILPVIDEQLEAWGDAEDWSLPIDNYKCSCEICEKIKMFFLQPTAKEISILVSEKIMEHILEIFDIIADLPAEFHITSLDEEQLYFVIEKLEKLRFDRQMCVETLKKHKEKLNWISKELNCLPPLHIINKTAKQTKLRKKEKGKGLFKGNKILKLAKQQHSRLPTLYKIPTNLYENSVSPLGPKMQNRCHNKS